MLCNACLIPTYMMNFSRITEIAITWGTKYNPPNSFTRFAQKQVNLRKVTAITNFDSNDTLGLNLLLTAIFKIPSLREFQLFHRNGTINWKSNWSILLCESNIENLDISCLRLSFENFRVSDAGLFSGAKLTTLAVRVKRFSSSDFVLHLLSVSPNLTSVRLSHVDRTVVKTVCTNLVKITTIMNECIDALDDWNLFYD